MGVIAYQITSSEKVTEIFGWIFLLISILGCLVFRTNGGVEYCLHYTKGIIDNNVYYALARSKYFLSNYIIGVFV